MIVSRLTSAILNVKCVARNVIYVESRHPRLLLNHELYQLWEMAKRKAEFVERQSNYHAWDTHTHITNELILRTVLELRIDDDIKNRGITGC